MSAMRHPFAALPPSLSSTAVFASDKIDAKAPSSSYRLTFPITRSNLPCHTSISWTACTRSASTSLNSCSSAQILSSCSFSLFSTPGSTEIRYVIWRVLVRRSRASSFCAAGKETGGAAGGAGGGAALELKFESGGGRLAVVVTFDGSEGLDGLLKALLEAGGLVGVGFGAGGDAALRGG